MEKNVSTDLAPNRGVCLLKPHSSSTSNTLHSLLAETILRPCVARRLSLAWREHQSYSSSLSIWTQAKIRRYLWHKMTLRELTRPHFRGPSVIAVESTQAHLVDATGKASIANPFSRNVPFTCNPNLNTTLIGFSIKI